MDGCFHAGSPRLVARSQDMRYPGREWMIGCKETLKALLCVSLPVQFLPNQRRETRTRPRQPPSPTLPLPSGAANDRERRAPHPCPARSRWGAAAAVPEPFGTPIAASLGPLPPSIWRSSRRPALPTLPHTSPATRPFQPSFSLPLELLKAGIIRGGRPTAYTSAPT